MAEPKNIHVLGKKEECVCSELSTESMGPVLSAAGAQALPLVLLDIVNLPAPNKGHFDEPEE